MDRWIINSPRWLMLAALVWAPWAYGSTRPWTVTTLNCILGGVLAFWFLSHLLRQRWPSVHPVMAATVSVLIFQAWFMALNAKFDYDPAAQEFIPLSPLFEWAPGSLDRTLSMQSATTVSLMLAMLFVAADLAQHSEWRKRILWTMGLTGLSLALLGMAQKFTNAPGIFWRPENLGENYFATWRNHTNAGAFLNLTWPIMAGLGVLAFTRNPPSWKRVLWCGAVAVTLAALAVNTSRAAAALALGLAIVWAGWIAWQFARGRFGDVNLPTALTAGAITVALVATLAVLAGLDSSTRRWRQFDKQLTEDNSRLLAARVCLKMIPDAGWFGFGPGTFQTAFPYYTHDMGDQIRGKWFFAHEDYLQTATEWGLAGGVCWGVLGFGGIVYSLLRFSKHRARLQDTTLAIHFAILTGMLGVLLHALVDFPLQIASIQLYMVTLLGLLWSGRHWLLPARQHPTPHRESKPARATANAAEADDAAKRPLRKPVPSLRLRLDG